MVFFMLESCTLVAVILTTRPKLELGAVNNTVFPALLESDPLAGASTAQVTALLNAPVTDATKVVVSASRNATRDAATLTTVMLEDTAIGLTVIVAVSVLLESALLVAMIVTLVTVVTVGAVNVLNCPWFSPAFQRCFSKSLPYLNAPVPFTSANTI
jgi:hypothetical protein